MASEQSPHNDQSHHLNLATNVDSGDIHICGVCKLNFSDLNMFMEHKRSQCLGPSRERVHSQQLLELVTTNSSDDNIGLSLVGLHPLYRVNVDGENAHQETRLIPVLQHLRAQDISGSLILRSRLLESNSEQTVEVSIDNPSNSSLVQEMISMHQQARREFEMDEEDVATLLANQLHNEVVSGVNPTSVSSFGGELLSRANISQTEDTGSPEPANLFSSDNVGLQKEGSHDANEDCRNSDPDESFNSPLPPQEEFILPADELVQGNLDCQPDTTDTQEGLVVQSAPRLKKRHCCEVKGCGFASFYLKDLTRHMRKHTGERPFHCKTCPKSFTRADKLQIHTRIHTGMKSHICTLCPYATVDASTLRKHMLTHTDERPYQCQMCSYRSRSTSHLTVHLRTHTGDCPFVCPEASCPAAFKTSSDLRRHARLHSGEKPYGCGICDYACNIKSNLKIHIRLNHTQYTPVPCATCNYIATSKRDAREHRKIHAGVFLKCGVCCVFSCADQTELKNHLATHAVKNPKGVSCKHCFFTCNQKRNLKRHMRSKHPDILLKKSRKSENQSMGYIKDNSQNDSATKPFCSKTHQCTICNIAFVRKDSWRSHLRHHKALGGEESNKKKPAELLAKNLLEISEKEHATRELIDIDKTVEAVSFIPTTSSVLSVSDEDCSVIKFQQSPSGSEEPSTGQSLCFSEVKSSETVLRSSSPPQSVYVYVTEGGSDSDLRGSELLTTPVVFSSQCGQYMTLPTEQLTVPLQGGMQFMLSGPLESIVNSDTFLSKEMLVGSAGFSHKHALIGTDSLIHSASGSNINFIEDDITPQSHIPTPIEVHGTDSVIKKF